MCPTKDSGFKKNGDRPSAHRFFIELVLWVFLSEFLVMVLVELFPLDSGWSIAIWDALLLCLLVMPAVYVFSFRPLVDYTDRLELTEGELARLNLGLLERVKEQTTDLQTANESLKNSLAKISAAEGELRRSHDTQSVLNALLRLSLEEMPLEEFLRRSIDLFLSIPWLAFQARGAVFLVEDEPGVLVMRGQNGLSEPIQKMCARVPFGRCLCGMAALTGKTQYSGKIDDHHEVSYGGIIPHGHYCVPMMFGQKVLGVINVYLEEGHAYDEKEEAFLLAVADILVGAIQRRRVEKTENVPSVVEQESWPR